MAEEERIRAKRAEIRRAEERMDYFERMMRERPRLYGVWFYWFHYWRVRRADWQTRLWLEELRAWKREVESWPFPEEYIKRAEEIRRSLRTVEDGLTVIERELEETRREARARMWRIRFPRPYRTMVRWARAIIRRLPRIREWIKRIKEELPAVWKNFVYVIYYAYTLPEAPRHLEAHLEGQCHDEREVQEKVKALANKLLRLWVTKPITTVATGIVKPGYAIPLLTSGMEKPPYEGRKRVGYQEWEWGVQWHRRLIEGEKVETLPEIKVKKTQTLHFEVYDYDYATVRMEDFIDVPGAFWELPQEELEKRLGIEEYMYRIWREMGPT
jgi:hypothetical protein